MADTAHKLGVTRPLDYFAIGLGVEAVSPLEMARAFATLANNGERIDGSVLGNVPRAVLRVETGRSADNDPVEKRAVGENDAAIVNSILQRVVTEGPAARRPRRPARGRQDRDDRELRRRLVRRLHAAARRRRLGRLPGPAEADGDRVRGRPGRGRNSPLIWKTFAEKALDHLEEPPESFPYPSYQSVAARSSTATTRSLLDNGNCREARQILYFVGLGPNAEADCKPNEVDVPNVVGMRLDAARDQLYSMPLTADVVWRQAKPKRSGA